MNLGTVMLAAIAATTSLGSLDDLAFGQDRLILAPLPGVSQPAPSSLTAATKETKLPRDEKNPWIAGALSAGVPMLSVGGGFWLLALEGLGVGQIYAGDPYRGLAIGGGFPLLLFCGILGGYLAAPSLNRDQQFAQQMVGMWGLGLPYYVWAVYDAYQTTIRLNEDGGESAMRPSTPLTLHF